jgi:hypothetical protein
MFDDDNNDYETDMSFDVDGHIEDILSRGGYTEDEIALIKERVLAAMQDPEYIKAFEEAGENGDVFLSVDAQGNYKAVTVTDPAIIEAMNELYYSDTPPTIH